MAQPVILATQWPGQRTTRGVVQGQPGLQSETSSEEKLKVGEGREKKNPHLECVS